MDILNLAIQKGLVKEDQIEDIKNEATRSGLSFEQVLLKKGVAPEDVLKLQGEYFNIPTRSVSLEDITDAILGYVPQESAEHYHFVPIGDNDGVLEVGVTNPDDIGAIDALNFISTKIGMPFKIFLISEEDFSKIFALYKGLTGEVSKALTELETELQTEIQAKGGKSKKEEEKIDKDTEGSDTKISEDAPVTKIVATILRYASDGNASDIHIEPWRENVKVRFRVDGVMN